MIDTTDMAKFTLVIADDDPTICLSLSELFGDDPRFDVCGVAHSGDVAAELAAKSGADLALVDVEMPQGGLAAIAAIRALSPSTQIAVFTATSGSRMRAQLLQAGAAAVFKKGEAVDLSGALAGLLTARNAVTS